MKYPIKWNTNPSNNYFITGNEENSALFIGIKAIPTNKLHLLPISYVGYIVNDAVEFEIPSTAFLKCFYPDICMDLCQEYWDAYVTESFSVPKMVVLPAVKIMSQNSKQS